MLRHVFLSLIIMLGLCAWAKQYNVDELPNVQLQDYTKHLVNPDGIISGAVASQIDSLLLDARRQSSAEIVAVIVDDISPEDIDTYANDLFNTWGIGKKDKNNGILLIVAKDSHQATIRTGYGAEGIMPDIIAGRIIYDTMIPHFRDDDYEGGMLAGVNEIHRIVTDPEAREELKSQLNDNYSGSGDVTGDQLLDLYLKVGFWVAIGLALWLVYLLIRIRAKHLTDYQKYQYLKQYQLTFWILTLIFVGIPILASGAMWLLRRHWREHARSCPNCKAPMQKVDEVNDNRYLSALQDLEERLDSVDYDVWLCPKCGETDVYSFTNDASTYKECPQCHGRTLKLDGTRIISEPTVTRKGKGEKIYTCLYCGNQHREKYDIPKKEPPAPIIIGRGGGGSGFSGGGFGGFGGGFGGGLTGGGGATGRW